MSILDNRTNFMNYLINKHDFKSYLELGLSNGWNYDQVKIQEKSGVDASAISLNYEHEFEENLHITTTDDFFEGHDKKYDLIFIDAKHEAQQVYKDFKNSFKCLNDNGIILFHDIWPKNEREISFSSMGNVFETWMHICDTYQSSVYIDYYYNDALGIFEKSLNPDWVDIEITPKKLSDFIENEDKYIYSRCVNNTQKTIIRLGHSENVYRCKRKAKSNV